MAKKAVDPALNAAKIAAFNARAEKKASARAAKDAKKAVLSNATSRPRTASPKSVGMTGSAITAPSVGTGALPSTSGVREAAGGFFSGGGLSGGGMSGIGGGGLGVVAPVNRPQPAGERPGVDGPPDLSYNSSLRPRPTFLQSLLGGPCKGGSCDPKKKKARESKTLSPPDSTRGYEL